MPKEYFSVNGTASLNQFAAGAKIHVIGVAGVAMAQLAIELSERGISITGSDKAFYEPMGSLLRGSKVKLFEGYSATNLAGEIALVIIGNVVSYGNPEVDEVERRKLPYSIFPKLLFESLISGRHSIVVSGTHGKTTTAGLCASTLQLLGAEPSYFIGGAVQNLPKSLRIGSGNISVVEGDEYDSAFFAKVPKFSFYHPNTAIVTSVEYDHADIYPDLASINAQFTKLIVEMPKDSLAICCIDGANARQLVDRWRKQAQCSIISYGSYPTADAQIVNIQEQPTSQLVSVHLPETGRETTFELQIPGRHNATNALAILLALNARGFEIEAIKDAFAKFRGVRRRQEVRFDRDGITIIDDFAHHPTAVKETLAALATRYTGRNLWAVFEPRSNTSRLQVFQDQYINAFGHAHRVVLSNVQARSIDSKDQLLDVEELARQITNRGTPAVALPGADTITKHLIDQVKPGDVVVIMSNGSFDGLVEKVVAQVDR